MTQADYEVHVSRAGCILNLWLHGTVVSSPDSHALWVKRPSGTLRAISWHRKLQAASIEDGQLKASLLVTSLRKWTLFGLMLSVGDGRI